MGKRLNHIAGTLSLLGVLRSPDGQLLNYLWVIYRRDVLNACFEEEQQYGF